MRLPTLPVLSGGPFPYSLNPFDRLSKDPARKGECFVDKKPLTVLVVDDDESVRKAMKRLLMSNGYRVLTFESAEDLLLSSFARDNVCLVLDICLPGLSGLDLYAKLSASGVKCPVIFMTAHDEPQWLELAERAGAVAFLRKPFEEHSLLDAVVHSQFLMKGSVDTTG